MQHAYGAAADIPPLLHDLDDLPAASGDQEPWYSLWSALAHQGDVYPAFFAAVPHVVQALASDPLRADSTYFQFPAWVETCRCKTGVAIPGDLAPAYFDALSRLPALVAAAAVRDWEPDFAACALAAVAAAKGHAAVAEAVIELTPDVAGEFMRWFLER